MAQGYDKYELDNQSGQSFRFALNDILEAVATQNSGPNPPNTTNTTYAYQTWVDTDALGGSGTVVKIRDAASAGTWYSLYKTDANGQPTGAVATGSYSISTNDTGGTGGTTAIFVDTSQNVGIGTALPSTLLHLKANSPYVTFEDDNDNQDWEIRPTSRFALYDVTNSAERLAVDSSGRLLVGSNTARSNLNNVGQSARFQLEGTSSSTNKALIVSNFNSATDAVPAGLYLARAGSTGVGSVAVVDADNQLGEVAFLGSDGTDFVQAAKINAEVDGTPGADDMPGRLVFSTNAGSTSPTPRMTIDSDGRLLVGTSTSLEPNAKIQVQNGHVHLYENNDAAGACYEVQWSSNGGATGTLTASLRGVQETTGASGGRLVFSTTASGGSSPTERMRIDNTGQVLIKAPDNSTTNVFFALQHNNGTGKVQLDMGGNVRAVNTSGIQAIVSERRLKTNINSIDLDQAWTNAKDIPWRTFEYLDNLGTEYTGHIVDEIEAVDPSLILPTDQVDDQGPIRTYDNAKLNAMRFVALQEALKRIETLEAKVAALEAS